MGSVRGHVQETGDTADPPRYIDSGERSRPIRVSKSVRAGIPDSRDDARAVARSRTGDRAAFLELFDRHADAVRAYLERRVGRQEADDLLAEVWLRAFASRASYRGAWPDGRPWLYGIARNTLRVHWQDRTRDLIGHGTVSSDPWPEVDARLDAEAIGETLREAILAISDDEREVLLLVAWEHLSPTEAAITLGIPPGTARSRLHRARTLLVGLVGEGLRATEP
jgi:RNA polymerase sigma-70 factor (ECF subfamily)